MEEFNALIKNEYKEIVKFDDGSTIEIEYKPYLLKTCSQEMENLLLSYYKEKFMNKIINNQKIIDIMIMNFFNKKLISFDIMCCDCKRVNRVNDILEKRQCKCYRNKLKDWDIVKNIKLYKSFNEFLDKEVYDNTKRYYIIDANKEITKDNILKCTFQEYFAKKQEISIPEIMLNERICLNCGKKNTKNDKKCVLCGAMIYKKNDIRYELFSSRLFEKNNINNMWDLNIKPLSIFIKDIEEIKFFFKDFSCKYICKMV